MPITILLDTTGFTFCSEHGLFHAQKKKKSKYHAFAAKSGHTTWSVKAGRLCNPWKKVSNTEQIKSCDLQLFILVVYILHERNSDGVFGVAQMWCLYSSPIFNTYRPSQVGLH